MRGRYGHGMSILYDSNGPVPSFAEIFPEIPESERAEAEENLDRYLQFILRLHERLRLDPATHAPLVGLTQRTRDL